MQQIDIAGTQPLETLLEAAVEAGKPAGSGGLGAMVLALEQQADHDRRQGSRQAIRGKHGEDDGEAERREKIFRRPLQKDHGNKDAAYGERRDQRRHGDAGRSVQGCFRQRPALLGQKPVRVLDRYGRIID